MAGRSTQHAIVYLLHLALEVLERGSVWVRWFFTDLKKGFDLKVTAYEPEGPSGRRLSPVLTL